MAEKNLEHIRHSLAHLLAAAVMQLYPDAKRAIGPAIDDGFYFDFEFSSPLAESDLPKIEKKMREIYKKWDGFERHELDAVAAKNEYPNNPYKHELIDEFSENGKKKVSFYKSGDYWDLCRGGHTESMKEVDIKAFKLDRLAGAYWRGDERNKMLTRIYGLAFGTKEELDAYLKQREEAKKRDHRKLGKELDLFAFSDLVGSGLPLFTPRGTVMRDEVTKFVWELMKPHGYLRVNIPHIAKVDLYKTSGHWDKFADDIFHVTSKKTDDKFIIKPMNCPHHTQIYASKPRSYRDLPLRYSEVTAIYRDENTGQLQGLTRVRNITQDDAHVFCRPDQIKEEALKIYDIITKFYQPFGMGLRIRLSTHDPKEMDKYLGGAELWEKSVGMLKELLGDLGKEYFVGVGEAAFYGPKLDFIATDAIGRDWQLATIQLDFVQPERFQLEYTDDKGASVRPVMIHRAILGSVERFLGVIIEHFAGSFPTWLAPEQIRIAPVSDKHNDFAVEICEKLRMADLRADVDTSANTVGKKIRAAETMKVPYVLVIGDQEKQSGQLAVRKRGSRDTTAMSFDEFVKMIEEEIRERKA